MIPPRYRLPAQVAGFLSVGVLIALAVFRLALFEAPRPTPTPAPAAPVSEPLKAVVVSVEGEVEHGRQGGGWSPLAPGETVQTNDVVRTGAHGRTDLRIDDRSHLTIDASSEVSVRELTGLVHRFRLTRGRMAADYDREGQRVLRVEDAAGESSAETRGARFSVLSTGTTIAVASSSGQVVLSSSGGSVTVGGGETSVVVRGRAPSLPARIPAAVLLKVANAISAASASLCAEVRGEAAPGSEVRIDGAPAALDGAGGFHQRVPRSPGKRETVVEIVDPAGRRSARRVRCVPLAAPIKDMAIQWNEEP